jgi:hypothetical protein
MIPFRETGKDRTKEGTASDENDASTPTDNRGEADMANVNMMGGNGSKGATKVAREQVARDAGLLYKAAEQLRGGTMYAYTVAVLWALNAFDGRTFPAAALSGMFGSPTVVNHHVGKGNLARVSLGKNGRIRLTEAGISHFGGRESGKILGQSVESKDARVLEMAIKRGPSRLLAEKSALVASITWRKTGETK